ncbi:Bug family tripartite tricarboxylate transporter substrate binding protein [Parapusillimonas granuli]|uniref:Tripartite tricarboxylate transporter substrate binding protein n=1 Tax=Parapusillimonas granuli TaxID=380911 RepID=A0A853FXB5_9BURK|nr:tripartite tricarboxylate transporter substrate binding protein [Parapusillimonas granuli]MBB5213483.1 tripartite-type tricarboxylate transporter receptor subunit TctC [Parapusillimonas granuli]MEB2398576.1 tripartite tricarboxylate transporter substrate binding protein [Alcaligenaceae bacterium]NYT48322.1 tripartite tricarboxylate transporter substrate binding protein [Parapusillimonas granuli]
MFKRIASALALAMLASTAAAADFPAKPVQMVVPYSPGGLTDNLARRYADKLSEAWKQPVVVENKPGAGSSIGAAAVARSAPDGYTMLLGSVGMVTNHMLLKKMPYEPSQLVPLALVALAPNVLYIHPSIPANNVKEFVEYAKKNPGKVSFASSGVGSSPHLAAELFASKTGIDAIQVPYKGTGPAIADFLGGQVNAYFDTMQSMKYAKDGSIRALGVTTEKRIADAPDLPTIEESGVASGVISSSWFGFFVPAATPADVQKRIVDTLRGIAQDQGMKVVVSEMGLVPDFQDQTQFKQFIQSETAKWGEVIRSQNISIQ